MSTHVPISRSAARAADPATPGAVDALAMSDETAASEMLTRVAQRLASAGSDLGVCFDVLASGAEGVLEAEGVLVAHVDSDAFHVDAAAGSLVPLTGFRAPIAGSLAADAIARGAALTLNDAASDSRVDAHFLTAFDPRQVAVAPMMLDDEGRGFVLAMNSHRGAFSAADGLLLQRIADQGALTIAHADLLARVQRTAHDSRVLSEIVQEINQSLELERVISLLAQHAAQLLEARGARVSIFDAGQLTTAGIWGDATDVLGTAVDLGHAFAGQAVRQRRTARTSDLRRYEDQWARPMERRDAATPTGQGTPNGVAAPLLVGDRAIGAVTVFGNEQREFTPHDEATLLALAGHAAVAIENARLYRAAAYTARHAHALAAAVRALAASTTPEAVYAGISQVARDALGAAGFSVMLADPADRRVELAHCEGVGAKGMGAGVGPPVPRREPGFWESASGEVAVSGMPRYAPTMDDMFAELPPVEAEALRAAGVCSMAILPLPVEGGKRGVLVLRFVSPHRFDEHERELLDDFGTQVAAAIRNAQLADAERRGRERERALADTVHQTEKMAAVGELVAGVAHELNNPLTGISTFAQLLLEDPLGEEQRESVRTIKREADRAVGVIRDLLAFSRKTGPRVVSIDLNALVTQTLRLRAYSLQTAGIDVESILDPELPAIVGDDQRLQQVLLNLVVNAEYAMHRRDARRLTVRTARDGAGVMSRAIVEITDTGTGMTQELVSHIFEPFFTTKPVGVGTGLGLSVSYGIVEAHGGTIGVRSTVGVGSTFTIAVPTASQSSTDRQTA